MLISPPPPRFQKQIYIHFTTSGSRKWGKILRENHFLMEMKVLVSILLVGSEKHELTKTSGFTSVEFWYLGSSL